MVDQQLCASCRRGRGHPNHGFSPSQVGPHGPARWSCEVGGRNHRHRLRLPPWPRGSSRANGWIRRLANVAMAESTHCISARHRCCRRRCWHRCSVQRTARWFHLCDRRITALGKTSGAVTGFDHYLFCRHMGGCVGSVRTGIWSEGIPTESGISTRTKVSN